MICLLCICVGYPRGFAHVTFLTRRIGNKAIEELNGEWCRTWQGTGRRAKYYSVIRWQASLVMSVHCPSELRFQCVVHEYVCRHRDDGTPPESKFCC